MYRRRSWCTSSLWRCANRTTAGSGSPRWSCWSIRRHHPRIDSSLVGETLGLTPAESQVAVWVARGRTVRDIAAITGRAENTVYWHLKRIYHKLSLSRQADLVQMVLSVTEFR